MHLSTVLGELFNSYGHDGNTLVDDGLERLAREVVSSTPVLFMGWRDWQGGEFNSYRQDRMGILLLMGWRGLGTREESTPHRGW